MVTKSSLPSPRRTANGFDYNRLFIILAILEKRCGLFYGTLDVYLNVVGGFRLDEPSGDLAVALCLYSSLTDKSISEHVTAFGELGLGGEVREYFQPDTANLRGRANGLSNLYYSETVYAWITIL